MTPYQRMARRQEKGIALRHGGRTRPGSGNQWHAKGDVVTDTELFEAKATTRASYSLKFTDLYVAATNALLAGKRMVFHISFMTQAGRGDYVLLTESDYTELKMRAGEEL